MEKYLSGTTHPSEVFELYNSMDVYDKEKFILMIISDELSTDILKTNNWSENQSYNKETFVEDESEEW